MGLNRNLSQLPAIYFKMKVILLADQLLKSTFTLRDLLRKLAIIAIFFISVERMIVIS